MGNLFEGGVAGHMSHLYDNPGLTFSKMKEILQAASSGNLEGTEKTDGQNLFLSFNVNDGKARAARNKGNIKAGGMTAAELAVKFGGRPGLEEAFNDAFAAFEQVVSQMTEEEQTEIFGENTNIYYNAEIQDPRNPNVVNYDMKTLTIHRVGHGEFDRSTGVKTGRDVSESAEKLAAALERYQGQRQQGQYQVQMNAIRKLESLSDDIALHKALSEIENTISNAGISDNQTVGEYVMSVAEKKIKEILVLDEESLSVVMEELRKRMYNLPGKNIRAVLKLIPDAETKQRAKEIIAGEYKQIYKQAIAPIESTIHDFAVEMMKGLQSAFILDNAAEVVRLRGELERAIKAIEASGQEELISVLQSQMKKLKSIENVTTAAEGFVFNYDGNSYKFTGNFAPMNQLLGLFRYGRGNIPPLEQLQETVVGVGSPGSIALIPGAFKPPHLGHLAMVEHYSRLADVVLVYISSPKSPKSQRGIEGGEIITPEMSKQLWERFTQGLDNVEVAISGAPSPFSVLYSMTSPKESPLPDGTKVYIGASAKGGDAKRFSGVVDRADPELIIMDPEQYVAPPEQLPAQYLKLLEQTGYLEKIPSAKDPKKEPNNYHASDLRFLLGQVCHDEKAKELVGFYVGPENVDLFLTTCGVVRGEEEMQISESQLRQIILEEAEAVLSEIEDPMLEPRANLSLPSAIAKISSLLDPFLDATVAHSEDGSEEYEDPIITEQAIGTLSEVIDLIQNAFLNMMVGENK